MRYLLDTNIWIEVLKGKNLRVVRRFAEISIDEIAACSPVRAELMHGAEKYNDAVARRNDVVRTLGRFITLPFDNDCADQYGLIRHDLEMRRCIIGPMDLQIAAIALVHDLTVVTGNVDEFKRVHGLRVKNWCE